MSSSLILLFFSVACVLDLSLVLCSSPFSTVGIGRVSDATVVCALVPERSTAESELYCTSLSSRRNLSYQSGTASYSAIAAGNNFLCGLTLSADESSNATMRWWDLAHAAADSRNHSEDYGKRVYQGPPLTALVSGDTHVCGLIGRDHKPQCWRWGVLQGLSASVNFSAIAVGRDFVCGLSGNGTVTCFGNETSVVGQEPADANFSLIAAGSSHACGVSGDGSLTCWGVGGPELGEIQLSSVAAMALGDNTTCVLLSNGKVQCLGNGSQPPAHLASEQFVSIHAKGGDICGIVWMNYSLVCWGSASLLQQNHMVYSRVLPGSCSPVSGCSCGFLSGSGEFCPFDEVICQSCQLQFGPNSPPSDQGSRRSQKTRMVFIIIGSMGFVIGLTALFIFLGVTTKKKKSSGGGIWWSGRERRQPPAVQPVEMEMPQSSRTNYNIAEFSLQLLFKITDSFSEAHKIGSGGFGVVYRAKLPDGREVAIKRAHVPSAPSTSSRYDPQRRREKERQRAFLSELALLSRINHKNLVRLIGFCQETGERILVYEYMVNGTLHDHLHHGPVTPATPLGTWSGRLRLALDAARGIEYLHTYAVPAIIHRDIKSSNILLDGEWTAKLSDFGLSLTSSEHDSSAAAGTVGYMDPEYYRLQRLTAKSDMYSFGVVLLELVTGWKAVEKSRDGVEEGEDREGSATPRNVVERAVPSIEADEVEWVMDRRVETATKEEQEAVAYVGYVAAECVKREGQERPTMVEVVGALERAVSICVGSTGPGRRPNAGRSEELFSGSLSEPVGPRRELARAEILPVAEGRQ